MNYSINVRIILLNFLFGISSPLDWIGISDFGIVWRYCVVNTLIFLVIFPIVTCFISAILGIKKQNLRWVFLIVIIFSILCMFIGLCITNSPFSFFVEWVLVVVCILSMIFVTCAAFKMEDDPETQSEVKSGGIDDE